MDRNRELAIDRAVSDLRSRTPLSQIRRGLAEDMFAPDQIREIMGEAIERAKVARQEDERAQRRQNLLIGLPIVAFGVGFSIWAWGQGGILLIPVGLIGYGIAECVGARNGLLKFFLGAPTDSTSDFSRRRRR